MPDVPIKPPNKRVGELTTKLSYQLADMFEKEAMPYNKQKKIADEAIKIAAFNMALVEELKKFIDENIR